MPDQSNGNEEGIVTKASPSPSASETLRRLREARLLIFGSPKTGTPLMVASPLLAPDLPLKILVWRNGEVLVSYNATSYLARRHHIPEEVLGNIAGIDALVQGALGRN